MAGKKISQLSGSLAPNLGSVVPIVYSGVTYKTTLQSLREVLVDGGSHVFTGSQQINGNLLVSGSVTASYFVGDGSQLTNLPNNGSGNVDVSMFLSSSIFTDASASFNDRIISATNEQNLSGYATVVSLNNVTQSVDSLIAQTGSYLKTLPGGLISGSVQVNYSGITGIPSATDVSMFLSSSAFNSFTSSYNDTSASFDDRINSATNEQDLSNLATTGSNTFSGSQTINGSLYIKGVSEALVVNDEFNYSNGSIFYINNLESNNDYNIVNVPTDNNNAVTVTFVIEQGSVPYSGSAYYINNQMVTVKWADSLIPTGSANKTNVIGLTAFRVNDSWNVLGSLSTFGS